jgi:hypothetical protein
VATISGDQLEEAQNRGRVVLAPVAGDAPSNSDLTASRRYEIGAEGALAIVYATESFHFVAGSDTVTATTASPGPFPSGVYAVTMPSGTTHVAMIRATGTAALGGAYKG